MPDLIALLNEAGLAGDLLVPSQEERRARADAVFSDLKQKFQKPNGR